MAATPLDSFGPFDSGTGANFYEDRWTTLASHWSRSGPIANYANEFQVYADSTGMQVKVKTGRCIIRGFAGESTAEKVLPIVAHTVDRVDDVVLRVDFTANNIVLDVLQGPGSITPPTKTQNTSIWEILIARVSVTGTTIAAADVSDQRIFAAGHGGFSKTVRGLVPSADTIGGPSAGQGVYTSDEKRLRVYDGSVLAFVGGKPLSAQCARNSNLAVANGGSDWTKVVCDVGNWDDGYGANGIHPGSSFCYNVAQEAGLWRGTALLEYASNSTGNRGLAFHKANAADYSSGVPSHVLALGPAASGVAHRITCSTVFTCAANDFIALLGWQDSGGSLNITRAIYTLELIGQR